MIKWTEASLEVLDIAQALIRDHHPWLREAIVGFIFRSEPSYSKGNAVLAQASKVDAKTQALLELGTNGWSIRGHDIEEFQSIIDRYGFWNYSLLNASNAFKKAVQLDLGLNPEITPLKGKVVSVQPDTMPVESIAA